MEIIITFSGLSINCLKEIVQNSSKSVLFLVKSFLIQEYYTILTSKVELLSRHNVEENSKVLFHELLYLHDIVFLYFCLIDIISLK